VYQGMITNVSPHITIFKTIYYKYNGTLIREIERFKIAEVVFIQTSDRDGNVVIIQLFSNLSPSIITYVLDADIIYM
jgi:hypothetical protein